MNTLIKTDIVEKMKDDLSIAIAKPTNGKRNVMAKHHFTQANEEEITEAHNNITTSALPRNIKNVPASILMMNDGTLDVKLPIGLKKSQYNKVMDMNTKDQGKCKVIARLQKRLEQKKGN